MWNPDGARSCQRRREGLETTPGAPSRDPQIRDAACGAPGTLANLRHVRGPDLITGATGRGRGSLRGLERRPSSRRDVDDPGYVALGMLIGAMIAVLLTVFAVWTRIGADLLTLLTLTLYSVPAIALLPLLILWFDTSPTSLVVVTVCSVTLPTAINLSAGLKSVNPTIMLVGQNLGLRGWGMFSAVLLPAALPQPSPDSEQAGPPAGAPLSPPDSSSALQAGGLRSSPTTPATSCQHLSSSQDYLPSPSPESWSKRPSACWSAVPSSDGE